MRIHGRSAHDEHSGLHGFYVYFGSDPGGLSNELYQPGNSYTPPPIANAGGWATYYLRVQAKDWAGNLAPWVTVFTLRYDGAPPSGTITINNDSSQTDTVQVELTLAASDEGSGVARMQFRNNNEEWHDWTGYVTHWGWQIPSVNRTTHTVSARFQDVAGNRSPVTVDDIFLEVQPPRPSSSNFVLSASVSSRWIMRTVSGMIGSIKRRRPVVSLKRSLGTPTLSGHEPETARGTGSHPAKTSTLSRYPHRALWWAILSRMGSLM